MRDQRGLSLIELLVGATLATLVAGGLLSAYLATSRSFGESSAQAALQRQGTLVLDEIARLARSAVGSNAIALVTCDGRPNSVQFATDQGPVCFYARADGALCEYRGATCRNLLAGGLEPIALLTQTAPPDPRCRANVAAGAPCFSMTRNEAYPSQVDVAFAIRDANGDLDGVNAMAFSISLSCSGRNC